MKKIVWTFGLISGAIASVLMMATVPFMDSIGFDKGLVFGYTSMVLSFLLVYFGIRSYRDNVGGGSIRFGRALAVGALITVISSACYVATWEVMYFKFTPDHMEKYTAYEIDRLKRSGAGPEEIQKRAAEMKVFNQQYQNPLFNSAVTFMEPLPVGLVITLVSAGVLSRRRRRVGGAELAPSSAL